MAEIALVVGGQKPGCARIAPSPRGSVLIWSRWVRRCRGARRCGSTYLFSVSSAVEGAGGGPRLNCGRTPDRKSRQGRPKVAHGFNRGSRVERAQSPEGAKEKMRLERPVLSSLTGLDSYSRPNPAMNRWAILERPCGTSTHDTLNTYPAASFGRCARPWARAPYCGLPQKPFRYYSPPRAEKQFHVSQTKQQHKPSALQGKETYCSAPRPWWRVRSWQQTPAPGMTSPAQPGSSPKQPTTVGKRSRLKTWARPK